MELFYVAPSPIHGKGLFAAVDIPAGSALFVVIYLKPLHAPRGSGYTLTNAWLLDYQTYYGKMFNHSNDPNTDMLQDGNEVWQFSVKDIKAGDEITGDYRTALDYFDKDITGFNL